MNKKTNPVSESASVFNAYAEYYELLYQDKDYEGEAAYVHQAIRRYNPEVKSILEFGSGTGRHASLLAAMGYQVHGVERSQGMLDQANQLNIPNAHFTLGDIRNAQVEGTFEAVLSLFHVISYLTDTESVLDTFKNARNHLDTGGLFLFDVWYGPAVLNQRPMVRVKRMEGARMKVTRLAEPELDANACQVVVRYEAMCRDSSGDVSTLSEDHKMRYFFLPEMIHYLKQASFAFLHAEEWMTGSSPGENTWGVCFTAKAV